MNKKTLWEKDIYKEKSFVTGHNICILSYTHELSYKYRSSHICKLFLQI
jgi:hypothetical protein